ncbi:MAG: DUF4040 domain-containing protein [Myxococcota bacterium]
MELTITIVLFGFLLFMAVVVGRQRDLFSAAMLTGIFSLVSAALFTVMDAVDVAFTEAAVGAGISTVLFLATLALTDEREQRPESFPWIAVAVVSVTGAALLYGTFDMPAFGDPNAPIHTGVAHHYVSESWNEIGLPNIVTGVLASYRGYDTFGELAVIFTAGVGVTLLLGSGAPAITEETPTIPQKSRAPYVREMPIVRSVTKALIPFVLLFALYVQAHGDFGPGGGFQAGVIFTAGLILYALVWGPGALERFIRRRLVERGMAIGVLLYGGVGVATQILGGRFLEYGVLTPEHPEHGQHYGIFLVELGVGITVSAVMLVVFYVFASRRRLVQNAEQLNLPFPLMPEGRPKRRKR